MAWIDEAEARCAAAKAGETYLNQSECDFALKLLREAAEFMRASCESDCPECEIKRAWTAALERGPEAK